MSSTVISARGLGKRYRIGDVETGFGRLRRRLAGRQPPGARWAIRDLTFDIAEGDAVAIVGRNGAGKSTLLKVLSRITEPTAGYVDVGGRVGALLEVGTGFHPQLTGRENVFLNGSILGMKRGEVQSKFDRIVEFSGISTYIDTPVKWYSTGMYMRLAFAVAAHLEPEILIVDEVLAVGDAEFQRRCLGRMSEVARDGRTVLFVSHNMQAVRALCRRALLLESGQLVADGETDTVIRRYLSAIEPADSGIRRWDDPDERPGNDECRLVEIRMSAEDGRTTASFLSSEPIVATVELDVLKPDPAMVVVLDVVSSDTTSVFRSYSTDHSESLHIGERTGRTAVRCTIPPEFLNSGRFHLGLRVIVRGIDGVLHIPDALHFDVAADHGEFAITPLHGRPGVVAPILHWEVTEPDEASEARPVDAAAAG